MKQYECCFADEHGAWERIEDVDAQGAAETFAADADALADETEFLVCVCELSNLGHRHERRFRVYVDHSPTFHAAEETDDRGPRD